MRFCLGCKCEVTDCDKVRDKSHTISGRWCFGHGRTLVSDRKRYANGGGQQFYGSLWGTELRLTARLAFLLRDMMPQGMAAAFDFLQRASQRPPRSLEERGSYVDGVGLRFSRARCD